MSLLIMPSPRYGFWTFVSLASCTLLATALPTADGSPLGPSRIDLRTPSSNETAENLAPLSFPLPFPSSVITGPNPTASDPSVHCFKEDPREYVIINKDICKDSLQLLKTRGWTKPQSWGPYTEPFITQWRVPHGICYIYLGAGVIGVRDTFSLEDVVMAADTVFDSCGNPSAGGLKYIGTLPKFRGFWMSICGRPDQIPPEPTGVSTITTLNYAPISYRLEDGTA